MERTINMQSQCCLSKFLRIFRHLGKTQLDESPIRCTSVDSMAFISELPASNVQLTVTLTLVPNTWFAKLTLECPSVAAMNEAFDICWITCKIKRQDWKKSTAISGE
jgi:hypothetical protein